MHFWWVNHKQTYKQEIGGGYLWSPKTNSDGSRNQTYNNMRRAVPGDVVFSYAYAQIGQVGVVSRPAASCPKPPEFGEAGSNWGQDGWMVPIDWHPVPEPLRPKQFIEELRPHLPVKYSPLNAATGGGNQNIYLTAVPDSMAVRWSPNSDRRLSSVRFCERRT
jgi:putative restriction endonuclease